MNQTPKLAALLLAGLVAACAGTTGPAPTPPPTLPHPGERPRTAPAVVALLGQADTELKSGAHERAIARLENALRIEPRNPFVWQRLARANLQQHRYDQAETLALRSISFARGDLALELENWKLIALARTGRGDPAGAQLAMDKVTALEDQLDD